MLLLPITKKSQHAKVSKIVSMYFQNFVLNQKNKTAALLHKQAQNAITCNQNSIAIQTTQLEKYMKIIYILKSGHTHIVLDMCCQNKLGIGF